MTIPRLELIAAHMATNSAANIKEALPSQNIRSLTCWTDSTVALQRLKDKGGATKYLSQIGLVKF